MSNFKLTSPAFNHEELIPRKYTCQGEDVNPELHIEAVPEDTKSLVLIMDDPDAPIGTWDHWVVYNIDPTISKIPENSVPPNAMQGRNSWKRNNYGGPCPPFGTHRYYFKLYALDTVLNLPIKSNKKVVEGAMKGHILAEAVLMGKYKKT
ncbi:MAG: YbhB/YbcL family Raf kinase inhibitor-like protein [Promethearchaeota archaeon]